MRARGTVLPIDDRDRDPELDQPAAIVHPPRVVWIAMLTLAERRELAKLDDERPAHDADSAYAEYRAD